MNKISCELPIASDGLLATHNAQLKRNDQELYQNRVAESLEKQGIFPAEHCRFVNRYGSSHADSIMGTA